MYKTARPLIFCATLVLAAACGDSASNNTNGTPNGATNNMVANNMMANNMTANNVMANNMTTGTNNNAPMVTFSGDVVPIFEANGCAAAGCHLDPGNMTSFVVGADADAAAFQAGLEGVMTATGRALVVGGDLDNSELYLRVTGTGVAQMPFGGSLTPDEIATVTQWITDGATF